jgi:hypothetical protein
MGDWYVTPTVTLTADDGWGRGIDGIEYRLDGGRWTTYEEPFRVLPPGEHTVDYRATDLNGNLEETNHVTFRNRGKPGAS